MNRRTPDQSPPIVAVAATADAGLEAVLDATRQLMWIANPAEAADVARKLVTALGGQSVPADSACSSDALQVDVSFGQGAPRVPSAPPVSLARLLLERHLPSFMVDAQRALALLDTVSRLASEDPARPLPDDEGVGAGGTVIAADLTAAEDLVRTVLDIAPAGIALLSLDSRFRVVSRSMCDLLGHDEAWFLARLVSDVIHPHDLEEALRERDRVLAGSIDVGMGRMRLVRADSTDVWVRRVWALIRDGASRPCLLMVQVEDVTAENDVQEAHAFQDPLTGLPNRAGIQARIGLDLHAAQRSGTSVGVLIVELSRLKVVNESLGHAAGDEVIAVVAERIVAALGSQDRVGRFGGDSFVIVVSDVENGLGVERCAERVSAAISADLLVGGHRIVPTASIGIATSNSSATPQSLLRDADSALSRAKTGGRGRWQFFDAQMHAQAVARLTIEDQLRDAINGRQFVVHYQPIVALADAHVVGHEALVRWRHPTRGLLSPEEFIDIAEDSGLITAIGAQVLDQACALLADRPDLPGPISVNVSAVQLAARDWHRSVRDTLARHGVDPARIVIEVTETAVLGLVDSAVIALRSLHRLGVGIHVDDFGTGYSSISLLRDLPVTGVKLDLRFVHDLTPGDGQANALAQGLSGLIKGMRLTGIAEGVETRMQADILTAQGWECGQGYYFGRPAAMRVSD